MLRQIFLLCSLAVNAIYCHGATTTLEAVHVGKLPLTIDGAVAIYDGEGSSVLLLGGSSGDGRQTQPYYDHILQYDLTSGTLEEVGKCPLPIVYGVGSQSAVSGAIYYFGGLTWNGGDDPFGDHTVWKVTDTFSNAENITIATNHEAYASITPFTDDEWYIVTGMFQDGYPSPIISKFTVSTETLEEVARLPQALSGISSVRHGDSVYMFGGDTQGFGEGPHYYRRDIFKLTPGANYSVEKLDVQLPAAFAHSKAVTVDDDIYIVGGWSSTDHFVTKFSPNENTAEHVYVDNLPIQLVLHAIVYVPETKRIYIFGGVNETLTTLDDVYYIQLDVESRQNGGRKNASKQKAHPINPTRKQQIQNFPFIPTATKINPI